MQDLVTFCHHSSRVKVSHSALNVWRLDYSGVLGAASFAALRAQALQATNGAAVLSIHVEKALILTSLMPAPGTAYRHNMAPAAVVVRPDQYQVWKNYADVMERLGVTRLIFLESQQAQAQRFLDCWLGAQSLIAQRMHGETTAL